MTETEKRKPERIWVAKALEWLGLTIDSLALIPDDPPDVRVNLGGKTIGIEVIQYHRDVVADGPSALHDQLSLRGKIHEGIQRYEPEYLNLNVSTSVFFKKTDEAVAGASPDHLPRLPGTQQIDRFAAELVRFVKDHAVRPGTSGKQFSDFGPAFPLLSEFVERLELVFCNGPATWNLDPEGSTCGQSRDVWMYHVQKKSDRVVSARRKKPDRFADFAELWLLIVAGCGANRIAVMPGFFQADAHFNEAVSKSPFASVVILDSPHHKVWQWARASGWIEKDRPDVV
jgi:hypothetical protein